MKISSILSVTAHVAAFSYSLFHLCLTRIIPLLAIIFASLVLHILGSLGLTVNAPSNNNNKPPAPVNSGATPAHYSPPGGHSDHQAANSDQLAAPVKPRPSLNHAARTSARWDQPVPPVNPTSQRHTRRENHRLDAPLEYPAGDLSSPAGLDTDNSWSTTEEEPVKPVPLYPHQESSHRRPLTGQNRLQQRYGPAVDATRRQPSDLPPCLDDTRAHPVAEIVPVRGSLPPSMSRVERAVRDHQEGARPINNKSTYIKRSLSKVEWEKYMSDFRKHFMLDS